MRLLAFLLAFALHAVAAVTLGAIELDPRGVDESPRVLALSLGGAAPAAAVECAGQDVVADDVREAPLPEPPPAEPIEFDVVQPPLSPDLAQLIALPTEVASTDALPADRADSPNSIDPLGPLAEGRVPLKLGPSREPRLGLEGSDGAGSSGADGSGAGVPLAAAGANPTEGAVPPATGGGNGSRGAESPSAGSDGSHDADATVDSPAPAYPRKAQVDHLEGVVVLLALVKADGSVEGCEVESSSGHDLLDDAARAALLRWKFKPRIVDGLARPFTARVPFRFSIPADSTRRSN